MQRDQRSERHNSPSSHREDSRESPHQQELASGGLRPHSNECSKDLQDDPNPNLQQSKEQDKEEGTPDYHRTENWELVTGWIPARLTVKELGGGPSNSQQRSCPGRCRKDQQVWQNSCSSCSSRTRDVSAKRRAGVIERRRRDGVAMSMINVDERRK